jgi:amino acid transporter
MASSPSAGSNELLSERVAGGILPKVLTSFDMVAIFVAIVLFITNAAVIQSAGPAAFGWWILGFLVFLIPGAIVTGQLGRMFPGEGSIYLWTNKAFGTFWGFFAGFCAWWPGVLVMVATGTVVFAFLGFVFPDQIGSLDIRVQGIVITLFIVFSAILSIMRFRVTQNIVNVVFVLYGLAILLMGAAGIVWLLAGHPAETNPLDFAAYSPSAEHGINFTNWTFFGLVILALLGVEVPLNMGVEIKDGRAITRYLLFGSLAVMAAYLLATFGIMVAVPADQAANVTSVASVVSIVFGSVLGNVVALILAGFFLFITVVYNYSFARLIFVSGLDRRLPAAMSHVNENKVPDTAVWVQTIVASVFTLLAFVVLPTIGFGGGTPVEVQTKIYDVLQAAVTVIWCLSMVVLFIDVVIIIRRFSGAFEATRLANPGVFYVCSLLGGIAAFVGIVATLSGAWTPLIPNDSGSVSILGATIAYGAWFYWIAGIAILSLIAGAILYVFGHRAERMASPEPGLAS